MATLPPRKCMPFLGDEYERDSLAVLVLGASGDLAKKKTFPSLFQLYCGGYLPENTMIFGYARSSMSDQDFHKSIVRGLKGQPDAVDDFLKHCHYRSGQYDDVNRLKSVAEEMAAFESKSGKRGCNRLFYFAVPPDVFAPAASAIKRAAMVDRGWNRLIVEKPFGRDYESSEELSRKLTSSFTEEQIYRIDHYLGKEMVQNLLLMRFSNRIFEPLWNSQSVKMVTITFKEDIGTEGRGGYFDHYGIIRDVMQNHLLQVLSLVAMEPPVRAAGEGYADFVRDEKVKVLNCVPPIKVSDVVLGQYVGNPEQDAPGYLDDDTVPKDSITPTFATAVLWICNSRWDGVPFVLKAGKALNERKAEIRVTFKHPAGVGQMFEGRKLGRNELVMRLQPDEAIYMKLNVKKPGLSTEAALTELDLTYKDRYDNPALPDAYTRLILDTLRGQQATFVRSDELRAAWKIFTPLLHQIEREKIKPIPYKFGSRGPAESDELIAKLGYEYHGGSYQWQPRGSL